MPQMSISGEITPRISRPSVSGHASTSNAYKLPVGHTEVCVLFVRFFVRSDFAGFSYAAVDGDVVSSTGASALRSRLRSIFGLHCQENVNGRAVGEIYAGLTRRSSRVICLVHACDCSEQDGQRMHRCHRRCTPTN